MQAYKQLSSCPLSEENEKLKIANIYSMSAIDRRWNMETKEQNF